MQKIISFVLLSLLYLPIACSSEVRKVEPKQVPEDNIEAEPPIDYNAILDSCLYTKSDSTKITSLLRMKTPSEGSDILFYARQFIGTPYVASTLEGHEKEPIIINTREVDCTTFVETIVALTMTKRRGSDKFADYAKALEKIRYRAGRRNGYLSRLHYFTWWMNDGLKKGIFEEVSDPAHFTAVKRINNHYMSSFAHKYNMLKSRPEWRDSIAVLEARENGLEASYLPEKLCGLSRDKLQSVKDGDILAIITQKDGLDCSHLGFAAWGKDGKLHLLNASSIYKRVVEDKATLLAYLLRQKHAIGVKVLRVKDNDD